jgi:hypothetical protein
MSTPKPFSGFCNSRWISAALVFLVRRKWISARIAQLAGLSVAGHIIARSVGQEQTLGDQLCGGLQGSESCDANSHARALLRSDISCLK